MFLSTPADIAIFGGAAGGGKTYSLLMDPLRYSGVRGMRSVTFRRLTTEIMKPGGLWDTSFDLYGPMGALPRMSPRMEWVFPGGMTHQFAHLQHESDITSWHGAQIGTLNFDEFTQFTKKQFWYLQSRVRSLTGIRGYVRATCNPDPDWWGLEQLIRWWIDEETGFPIPTRSGKIRWFIRRDDNLIWADSKKELVEKFGDDGMHAKSLTFIPSKLSDNMILMERDPSYLGNLHSLSYVDRMRLLEGNWKIREQAGNVFKREWFQVVDALPVDVAAIRYWDRAATVEKNGNDPDWTVGTRMSRGANGLFYVEDMIRIRGTPGEVERAIKNTASRDGIRVTIGIEQDPGQAGKMESDYYVRALAGYDIRVYPVSKSKLTRAKPASAQAEAGNIKLIRASWNEDFLNELENFPQGKHDDIVDSVSGCINALAQMYSETPFVG
jgi:predicted phage terminase large subunit-like protein